MTRYLLSSRNPTAFQVGIYTWLQVQSGPHLRAEQSAAQVPGAHAAMKIRSSYMAVVRAQVQYMAALGGKLRIHLRRKGQGNGYEIRIANDLNDLAGPGEIWGWHNWKV